MKFFGKMQLNMANIRRQFRQFKVSQFRAGMGVAGLTLLARNGGKSHKLRAKSYAKVVDCEI